MVLLVVPSKAYLGQIEAADTPILSASQAPSISRPALSPLLVEMTNRPAACAWVKAVPDTRYV
jgi:hypothetical protein